MIADDARVLILPGLYDSGPEHWQSRWRAAHADLRKVEQADWQTPKRTDWVATLDAAIAAERGDVVLVAHSLACTLVSYWVASVPRAIDRVRGALLVAPSDTEARSYPPGTEGFVPVPMARLPFRSIVVASSDDVYVTLARAQAFARAWGSEFVDIGPAGHINSSSGLGDWAAGYSLLEDLRRARR